MKARTPSAPRPDRVELRFLESVRKRCPAHMPTLEALGHLYTRSGQYREGLQVDRVITTIQPNESEHWYNLACSLALTGEADEAFAALARAVEQGYDDAGWMVEDEDLAALRTDARFADLLRRVRQRARAARTV